MFAKILMGATMMVTPISAMAETAPSATFGANPTLPAPDTSHSATKFSKIVGWGEGEMPKVPAGFAVTRFATGLDSPRALLVLPNGDVLVAEATSRAKPAAEQTANDRGQMGSGSAGTSADRITLLRDRDGDGVAEHRTVLLRDLNQPFGMAFADGQLYVANTDAILRFPFKPGDETISAKGEPILSLPAGGYNNHWTRNLLPGRDGRLFVSVGSASNVGEFGLEREERRAAILSVKMDGSDERIAGSGLRNPVGMSIEPTTGALWTVVNERDMLGDNLVPDYLTSVRDGGFYGWPYAYWGTKPDPRLLGQKPELVAKSIEPDYALGPHTASLGLTFYTAQAFPQAYRGGAFIAQRGSWNRSAFTGYKVVFVPFKDGKPAGAPQDFLTGFLTGRDDVSAHGRPVGVYEDGKGALLVTDDAGNSVWRVTAR